MKARSILYHSLFWVVIYLLWVLVFRSYSFSITKTMTVEFCYLVFITADFYIINNVIIPQLLVKKRYAFFLMTTIVIIAVSAWLRALVAVQMNIHFFQTRQASFGTLYINSLVNISVWVLLINIIKMLTDRITTQQQLELLENERIKTELDFLKAQINPHALLNSLNTIYGHIDKSNQKARNVLLQFSELLKYQLYECSAEMVGLEKEIDYLKNYVAFQRLRKDDRLVVDIDIHSINPMLTIAPLLIVVLIENAFKFASSFSNKENKIGINISTKDNILHCTITNTKEANQNINDSCGGIGLVNLKRRLELLYTKKYELLIANEDDLYTTTLMINLA